MAYAYFKQDCTLLTIASDQSYYADPTIIEIEVPLGTMPNAIYLDRETLTVKQRQPFSPSVSYNLIEGLPVGTTMVMRDGLYVVDDGSAEFEADVYETIFVNLSHPHYMDQFVAVTLGPEVA